MPRNTLFLMLLKFGAVQSIICGFWWRFYIWTYLLQCIVVVYKLDLSRGSLTQFHSVLDHGLNLNKNIPLRPPHTTQMSNYLIRPLSDHSIASFFLFFWGIDTFIWQWKDQKEGRGGGSDLQYRSSGRIRARVHCVRGMRFNHSTTCAPPLVWSVRHKSCIEHTASNMLLAPQ